MEEGAYNVTSNDLPADEIYQCGEQGRQLCIRALEAGEKNNPVLIIKGTPFEAGWHIATRLSSVSAR
jgi:hypothetical protein